MINVTENDLRSKLTNYTGFKRFKYILSKMKQERKGNLCQNFQKYGFSIQVCKSGQMLWLSEHMYNLKAPSGSNPLPPPTLYKVGIDLL